MQPESLSTCITSFRKRTTPKRDCLILKHGAGHGFHVVLVEPEIAANTGDRPDLRGGGATLWLVRPLGFHSTTAACAAGLDYWRTSTSASPTWQVK
jgi:hypothetical protein